MISTYMVHQSGSMEEEAGENLPSRFAMRILDILPHLNNSLYLPEFARVT